LGAREAIVIGAGLAGCSSALALARRGWHVTVVEAGTATACGASALPSGLLHPTLAADDSHAARLSRAGFLFGRSQLDRLDAREPLISACGVLQMASDECDEDRWPQLLRQQRWPAGFVRWCQPSEAAEAAGVRPRRGGLWFGDGAVVSAAAWCRAMLAAQPGIRLHGGHRAARIVRQSGSWRIEGCATPIAPSPVIVVASAIDAPRLLEAQFAPVRPIRGRITHLAAGELKRLRAGIAGQGTVVPGLDGRVSVGATYEPIGPDEGPGISDGCADESNVERLSRLLAQPPTVRIEGSFDGIRCVATDRTPLAGAVGDEGSALAARAGLQGAHLPDLPRRAGLYCSFALGSRGLALAPLLGELIACLIEGEPAPIERSLAATVDPGRFLLRRLRKR
jgi:tRNA 5-methylaminomethyl-2-thiouridine biosynthesis bifunctional protein